MPGDNDDAKMMPGKTLSDAHSDRIVALKVLSSSPDAVEPDLLLSASRDGSFALWDINSGDLVTRCQMFADGSEPETITCADVDTSGVDGDVIFFGLGSGYVNGFYVNDVIGSASVGGICPIPSSRFQANDGGVTAILAAGLGTSMSSSLQQARPTTILLTGGADGLVKQW
jgi:WD40 repeat protein